MKLISIIGKITSVKYFIPGLFTVFTGSFLSAQPVQKKIRIDLLTEGVSTSIRAMNILNDSVVWVGGSNGFVGKTTNGGGTWQWMHPDHERLDFRSLTAFDSSHAVVANAGSPATIFLTSDGGNHWQKVYSNPDTAFFFDGMVFRNKKDGIIYGDPVNGKFIILSTKDRGKHWKLLPLKKRPEAMQGEASFAASNSAIFNLPGSKYIWLGTGGKTARLFFSKDFGKKWTKRNTAMLQGKSSMGIFSIAFINKNNGICVGGDYADDLVRLNNALLIRNVGKKYQKPIVNPFGYRSCVIYFSPDTLLCTGTSGTDLSVDGGLTWSRLSPMGFNVLQRAKNGHTVFLAGNGGRIAQIIFPQNVHSTH